MSGVFLALGLVIGALAQRWLGGTSSGAAAPEPAPDPGNQPGQASADAPPPSDPALYLAYLRALEQVQFRGGFLARTAHELRSPLSSLMGLLQLILADLCDDPAEERQCVAQAYEAAQNLNQLMDQMIRVSKLEQGSQRLDPQTVDLASLLEDVQSLVQLQVADRNARLTLELPPQAVYAQLDYNSIRQMLVMLIEAAIAAQATTIRLVLPRPAPGGTVRLHLADDRPAAAWQEAIALLHPPVADKPEPLPSQLPHPLTGQLQARLQRQLAPAPSQDQSPIPSFVPQRLSPGLALLASQLILALNQGGLTPCATEPAAPAGAMLEPLGAALELWFPQG